MTTTLQGRPGRVTIETALGVASLLLALGGIAYSAGIVAARVDALCIRVAAVEVRVEPLPAAMARQEALWVSVDGRLERIEGMLDREPTVHRGQ